MGGKLIKLQVMLQDVYTNLLVACTTAEGCLGLAKYFEPKRRVRMGDIL